MIFRFTATLDVPPYRSLIVVMSATDYRQNHLEFMRKEHTFLSILGQIISVANSFISMGYRSLGTVCRVTRRARL
jgi:hypothetical protein